MVIRGCTHGFPTTPMEKQTEPEENDLENNERIDDMGIIIPFHSFGSTKSKIARNSGLSRLKGKSPDRAQQNFAGMEPREAHWFNVGCETPNLRASSARGNPLDLMTWAAVIDMFPSTSLSGNLSRQLEVRKKVICNSSTVIYSKRMANRLAPKKGRPYSEIGERLERIQILMGYGEEGGGAAMAKALRLTEGQWSVFRSGTREIGIPYASRLCDWCEEYLDGATLDWIYRGKGPSPRPIQRAIPGLRKPA